MLSFESQRILYIVDYMIGTIQFFTPSYFKIFMSMILAKLSFVILSLHLTKLN